jgi:spoIIIJ-associated protein
VTSREFVDVRGPSVETAVAAGLEELGLKEDDAEIEVLQEPSRGFLGIGGEDAVVRIRRRPRRESSGRGRRSRGGRGKGRESSGGRSGGDRSGREKSGGKQGTANRGSEPKERKPAKERKKNTERPMKDDRDVIPIEDQAEEIKRFLTGLLESFGLDGEVTTRLEEDVIYADVAGEQTEALVGPKGAILQSVLELCRTIVQRKTQEGARIRLDIAGYTQRRREALGIYARRLTDKVLEEGGEIMLEPMNSADRKVVHDTVAEIDGVRSYSEGEEPHRSVIVAKEE